MRFFQWLQTLKSPRSGHHAGAIGFVGSKGLHKGSVGEVTCAGSIAHAELASDLTIEALEAGAQVRVVKTNGAKLIVEPRE